MMLPPHLNTPAFNLRMAVQSGGLQIWHAQDLANLVGGLGGNPAVIDKLQRDELALYLNLLLIEFLTR